MITRLLRSASVGCIAYLLSAPAAAQVTTTEQTAPATTAVSAGSTPDAQVSTSEAPTDADIVVTGFRASLQSAIAQKRNSAAIVDSISSEDIGKFPEQNLAESLQRITGVQISRSRGEGQNISIRGLSPEFNQINMNGRTLPSATGSRSFDFTILSSDFISGIDVYKTPTADMTEGGLAGTVNVRTLRPKDVTGLRLAANVEGLYEGNSKKVGPHASLLFANRFLDDKLSIIVGVDYSKRKFQTYRYEAFGLETTGEAGKNLDYNRDGDRADTFLINHAASFVADFGSRERLSGLVSIGYDFSDTFSVWGEALGSRFVNDYRTALNAHRFTNISDPNGIVASTIDSNGILTTFDANGVDNRNNGRPNYYKDTLESYAGGASWTNDALRVDVEGSYGQSRRVATDVSLEVISRASVSQVLSSDPGDPAQVTYQRGYDPLNRDNWRALGLNGAYKQPTTDTTQELKADIAYDFDESFVKSIKVGGQIARRERSVKSQFVQIGAEQLAPVLGKAYSATIEGGSFAAGDYMQEYDFSNFLGGYDGDVTIPANYLSSDPRLVFDQVSLETLVGRFGSRSELSPTRPMARSPRTAAARSMPARSPTSSRSRSAPIRKPRATHSSISSPTPRTAREPRTWIMRPASITTDRSTTWRCW